MGLFSGKIRTYVSSVVYNMAGDVNLRPDFMKDTVTGAILTGNSQNLGGTITSALLNSTAMKQQAFFRWANDGNYALGMPDATIGSTQTVSTTAIYDGLDAALGLGSTQSLRIMSAFIDSADIDPWVQIWIQENHPGIPEADWTADYDPAIPEIVISVTGEPVTHIPASADLVWGFAEKQRKLLYILYHLQTTNATNGTITEGPVQLFTYRMGSGNADFDGLTAASTPLAEFFPALPLRLDNLPINDPSLTDEYAAVSAGYKKLTGRKVDDILEQIEDNENVDDIDFCFIVHGVALNAEDKAARNYLYTFFKSLIPYQVQTRDDFLNYLETARSAWRESIAEWQRFIIDNDPDRAYSAKNIAMPLGLQEFARPPAYSVLTVRSPDLPEFHYELHWAAITETAHVGNAKAYDGDTTRGHLGPGDYWIHVAPPLQVRYPAPAWTHSESEASFTGWVPKFFTRVYLFHQTGPLTYTKLELLDLSHRNFVYQGKFVQTLATEAMADEDESGFLVPLHYPTLKAIGLSKAAQLATSSSYLVFNCYVQVKQKWYQTGIFKVLMIIISIVISIVFPPAGGLAGASGILGTNAAVGASLGIASLSAAAVAGAVANAIAGIIVASLIQKASISLFGEKFGAIIGAIVSFVALTYGHQYAVHGNFAVNWGELMRVENIMKMTTAVGDAYNNWVAMDIAAEAESLQDRYKDQMDEVDRRSEEILGMTNGGIDPMMLTDTVEQLAESRDSFLNRTLLTGSDIAELTHKLIEDFAEISLELPRAFA